MENTVERNLYEALEAFLESRGKKLSEEQMEDIVIPTSDGTRYRVPVVMLLHGTNPGHAVQNTAKE